ncbi:hypothetical protein SLS64_004843 [Diaporthe eres]
MDFHPRPRRFRLGIYHRASEQEALGGKVIHLSQGKLLGGSSAINGQAFVANSKAAIDAWAHFSSPGWDWETLSPYFRKFHSLSRPSPEACKHLRLDYIDDDIRVSIDPKSGTRSDAATAYFEPAKGRPNLHMLTGALAEKIILDTSGRIPKAVGVQVSQDGNSSVLTAKREVILAAGVFGTPKLLELSGIGGKPLLDKLGIPVVVDNPNVGENLQDHPNTGVSFEVADGVKTMDGLSRLEPEAVNAAIQDYINHKRGPLAVGGNFAGALIPVPDFVKGAGTEALLKQVLDDTAAVHVPGDFTPYHEEFVRSLLTKPSEGVANVFTYAACGKNLLTPLIPGVRLQQKRLFSNYENKD